MSVRIIQGNCLDVLPTLPDASVNCCVTSPPYWGLRDYGHAGQIGLERTPEEYVSALVAVFREVRRILRDDGVLFLNLGDSFMAHPGQRKATDKAGQKQQSCRGSTACPSRSSGDIPPTQSRSDAPACGSGDTEPPDSPGFDCAYPCLCDACLVAHLRTRTESICQPQEPTASCVREKAHDTDRAAESRPTEPACVPASTTAESSLGLSASRWRCANCGADLSVSRSSAPCVHLFAHTSGEPEGTLERTEGNASLCAEPPRHIRCTSWNCSLRVSCGSPVEVDPQRTTDAGWSQHLKPKDLVGIPWRVAFALQADGWWLRSDIVWSKPNPMPESVTDRPTKSHEYLFLLAKSDRYYYDAKAIMEPVQSGPSDVRKMLEGKDRIDAKHFHTDAGPLAAANHRTHIGNKRAVGGTKIHGNLPGRDDGGRACNDPEQLFRNKRDVWTVGTSTYDGAHFATFPTALITPCILAGCPVGGTVLDPFGGSGTTGEVAESCGRNSILIELNPEYIKLQERRTAQGGLAL